MYVDRFDRLYHTSVCSTGLGVILNFYKSQQFLSGLAVSGLVGQCSAISATVILFR